MKATITKIHPPKSSDNNDTTFIRVEFKLEDGSWAKTDICKQYRNYERWVDIIQAGVGTVLNNLEFKGSGKMIDADSEVELVSRPPKETDLTTINITLKFKAKSKEQEQVAIGKIKKVISAYRIFVEDIIEEKVNGQIGITRKFS